MPPLMTSDAQPSAAQRALPILLFLFIGSGCAALIYEIVWFQLLQLVIGSSAVSLAVLLGTFMGGMCLGSLLLPKYVSPKEHPLKVYAFLELGIAACGLFVLFGAPLIGGWYDALGLQGMPGIIGRGIVAAICLLPPTLMMGATLPAMSRWVETTPAGVSWLGYFYGGNIAGAVVGSLLAGFYLLRMFDMVTATVVAIALNVVVASIGLWLAGRTPHEAAVETKTKSESGVRSVYIAIALSGLTALASEVMWTKVLSLQFGATTYTFSLILAVFLTGLGIGSTVGASLAKSVARPRVAFGWCQMLICGAMAWAAYQMFESLPFWPINPSISSQLNGTVNADAFNFQLDLVRCFWVVLPGAILWGASFPLALAAAASKGQDPAKLVGGIYAANTVGAIVGALLASVVLVWFFGSQHAIQLMIGVSALSGLMMLAPAVSETDAKGFKWGPAILLILATGGAGLLVRNVPQIPGILIAYGRYAATWVGQNEIIYAQEGLQASVAVSRTPTGVLNYHNAGKVQASSEPQDMRLQRMLGHLTTLIPPDPKRVLVIGCGAGVTAGAVSISPYVTNQTIAEIEPLVPSSVSKYFGEHNYNVVTNPKVHVQIDDARHYLLTSKEKFDAITSDPLDPWVKGAASLYTKEFFDVAKAHLNPGGVVTLFVQMYESNEAAVKSEIGTFLESFPNGMVFGNTQNGRGYDLVLLGQVEETRIDVDAMQAKLDRPEMAPVAQSLREVGFANAVELFATFAGQKVDLANWLKDVQINHDRNLKLQYLAGLGLNLYQSDKIYANMLQYPFRFPTNIFSGSETTLQALRDQMYRAQSR
ncbi:MAG: SAM-dependent methyltransferase [Acidobacteria bacterium]|nr:MAG: SAM-dependent methyltransferase [Acidobacteriota bacterium]